MNLLNAESIKQYKEWLGIQKYPAHYANVIKWWLEYMERNNIVDITVDNLLKFFTEMGYSRATQNLTLNAGRNYYTKFLGIPKKKNEWYDISIKTVKYEKKDPLTYIDVIEIKKYLITYYSQYYSIPKIEAFVDFFIDSGCGEGEFLALKREHFDLPNNKVKVEGEELRYSDKTKKEIEYYFRTEPEKINAFNIADGKLGYIMGLVGKGLNKKVTTKIFKDSSARHLIELCTKYWRN